MKRAPASARPKIPDHIPPENPWHGSVGERLASKDAEIARLRLELDACKRELRAWQSIANDLRLPMIRAIRKLEEAT